MPYKVCPYCGKKSYSAASNPELTWICPYCKEDITHVEGLMHDPDSDSKDKKKED